MSANDSAATRAHAYQPTIIEHRLLLRRLAIQIAFVRDECKRDPRAFAKQLIRDCYTNPKIMICFLVTAVVFSVVLKLTNDIATYPGDPLLESVEDVVMLEPIEPSDGPPRGGFDNGGGKGSAPIERHAHSGENGSDHNSQTPRTGQLPPPPDVVASIPIKLSPVSGDPKSIFTIPSPGPGEGGGIEWKGGIGLGDGSALTAGRAGNTGVGFGINGCCGGGLAGDGGPGGGGSGTATWEGYRSAQLISIPEPEYTEEARRYQVSGTVVLRALLSSSGEVVEVRAVNTLPFGLTERAIAAARQIKFVPATKDRHSVSVYMQLEYNFDLY